MRLTYGLPLCALLLTLSSCTTIDDRYKKKKTSILLAEVTEPKQAFDFDSVGVSIDDLLPFSPLTTVTQPVEPILSPGAEFVAEKPSPDNEDSEGQKLYEQALKFFRKGYGYDEKIKGNAYILIAAAAKLGHQDAKKLMGFAYLFGDKARFAPDEAKEIFTELAAKGSADAHLGLGFMYSVGLGVKRNRDKAHLHLSFAAMGGSPLAKMAMGYRYLFGVGVTTSCHTALHYYKDVALGVANKVSFANGVAAHRIHLTDDAMRFPHPRKLPLILDLNLLEYYRLMAKRSEEVGAQYSLGRLYLIGNKGLRQDFKEAEKYLSMAVEGGSMDAAVDLGRMYLEGTHATPQNNVTAFELFLKAAEKKVPLGYTGLGVMYLKGDGVREDHIKAAKLFRLAADQGEGEGQLFLGGMYIKGLGVDRDFKLAFEYFQRAAKSGQVLAYYNLAAMYLTLGLATEGSCPTAAELFKNVAERGPWSEKLTEALLAHMSGRSGEAAVKYLFLAELGYEPAQTNFADLMDRGKANSTIPGSRNETYSRALLQWLRGAKQDQVEASIKLGDYYYYGRGIGVNYERAAAYYEDAAQMHHSAQAMFNLGYMHQHGIGVKQDVHMAKRYYDAAAEQTEDAYVPVHLALLNMQFKAYIDATNELPLFKYLDSTFGRVFWGDFVMAVLAVVVLIASIAFWRQRPAEQPDF